MFASLGYIQRGRNLFAGNGLYKLQIRKQIQHEKNGFIHPDPNHWPCNRHLHQPECIWNTLKKPFSDTFTPFDDTRQSNWDTGFKVVEIQSSLDNSLQKAYFLKSKSSSPKPLVVSLHSWSGNYEQKDELATAVQKLKTLTISIPISEE